ncbi:MAG: GNAT family N-acetyltransferase [Bacilli bacterium]|nr:GNAT family N-acetyltransferase [Bacilli bacterium]
MIIKKFNLKKDLEKLENYLREQYLENKNMTSWLPERLHDLIYRMDTQYIEAGKPKSSDYIYFWEDKNQIIGCILPDGDAIYISLDKKYEDLYKSIVSYAEENCKPLFKKENDGTVDFLVITNDSLDNRKDILEGNGYTRQVEEDYDNFVYPQEINVTIELPKGYRLVYGDEYTDEENKWSACSLGFHPDKEDPNYRNGMSPYNSRKKSSMYKDSFECLVIDENTKEHNDVCSYCFVYIDTASKTAFIEPVSTREKYRHKGIGTAMMHGVILKCKEIGIEKCYVNSYDWRRKFYNAAGFITEDSIGFYHKRIK